VVDIEYADIVDGYRRLLRDIIREPVVVICHSMGGATTWQLLEHERDLVAGVVSVAASFPGNIVPSAEVLEDDGTTIRFRFAESGAVFVADRSRGYLYEDDYIYKQGIASSTRFPMDRVDQLRAGLVPFPPRMLLQRVGLLPGLPAVANKGSFSGVKIRLIAGTEDPAHTAAIEHSTVELLGSWGADVDLVWLGELGITGNGHFLMFEDNCDDILAIIAEQVEVVTPDSTKAV
jgi:pimeloyl-ACP methyl ester carboxylesterase